MSKSYSSYRVKICHYNTVFRKTTELYRSAVDFFIDVALREWDTLSGCRGKERNNRMEEFTIRTKGRPCVSYDFGKDFYKFPSYLRRAAIQEALGAVSSYQTRMEEWKAGSCEHRGRKPGRPKAGRIFPVLYKDNTYVRVSDCHARIKVFIRNTWDWLDVELKASDVRYILNHCQDRKEHCPTLLRKGKEWFLVFPFSESSDLISRELKSRRILSVDLGINQACVCAAMKPDGTVTGRFFLKLPVEKDCLDKAVGRIKKAQQHGARKTPRLWALAKGINDNIADKTAAFIVETAASCQADVIVFEHLELGRRKRGSKKQRLHLWKARKVQKIVTGKAHRIGIHISRVNAWGTSALAFDGSGKVVRGEDSNYSVCVFPSGKIYHCDLNASYNIGARYYIREHLKSLPETERLALEEKIPSCAKRSTCTLSSLISLHAVLSGSDRTATESRLYGGKEILSA